MEKTNIKQKITKIFDFLYCNKIDKKSYYFDVYWTDENHPEIFSEYLNIIIEEINKRVSIYDLKIIDVDVNDIKPFKKIKHLKKPYNIKRFVVNSISLEQYKEIFLSMVTEYTVRLVINGIQVKIPILGKYGIIKGDKYIPIKEYLSISYLFAKIRNFFEHLHYHIRYQWKSYIKYKLESFDLFNFLI